MKAFGEGFYLVDVAVERLSGQADILPLMVSERMLDVRRDYSGDTMEPLASSVPTTAMRHQEPPGAVRFCPGGPFHEGIYRLYKDKSDISGWLHL